jgi:hypothetical protein
MSPLLVVKFIFDSTKGICQNGVSRDTGNAGNRSLPIMNSIALLPLRIMLSTSKSPLVITYSWQPHSLFAI